MKKSQKKNAQKAGMTRKEALATLYKFWDATGSHLYLESASEEEKALRGQVYAALSILKMSIHGEPPLGATMTICNICYLRYAPLSQPWVFLKSDAFGTAKDVCTECLERLKTEGKVERLENWKTGEVIPC